jgi:hypothetical protein
MAANQVLTWFSASGLDGIVFIDPYVRWEPEVFFDLCATDKDAIGVPLAIKTGFELELGDISTLQEDDKTGEIVVRSTSLGFFFLSSHAVKRLANTHHLIHYMGENVKLILQSGDIYSDYCTCDKVISQRLLELGIYTWVNPNHTVYLEEVSDCSHNFLFSLNNMKENG